MLVIGDMHYTSNWIKKLQVEKFVDWLNKQEALISAKNIVLLGDLFEIPTPEAFLVAFYLKLFARDWGDKHIYILEGNHDSNAEEDALDHFMYLDNVTVVKEATEIQIEGNKCLFLPHYDHEGTYKRPMTEVYSELSGSYDYIFSHVMDETQSFGKAVCDLSNLQGRKLFGHVHSPNILKGGNYLGSVIKNSSTEKDDQKILANITSTGLDYVTVPSFLEYETVEFGNEIACKDKLVLLTVTEAPTRAEAVDFYEAKNSNVKINKVITKRQRVLSTEVVTDFSDQDAWETFCKEKNLPDSVKEICTKVILAS